MQVLEHKGSSDLFVLIPSHFLHDSRQVSSLRWIGRHVPTRMLACAKDHWFPEEHVNHLKSLQQRGILPWNIDIAYEPKMKHDYICHPEQADKVVNLCEAWIRETNVTKWPRSRL